MISKRKNVDDEYDVMEESDLTKSDGETYQLARDRKRRQIKPPKRYIDLTAYALSAANEINDNERKTYHDTIISKNKQEWKRAIDEEIESLIKNKTGS